MRRGEREGEERERRKLTEREGGGEDEEGERGIERSCVHCTCQ